MVENMTAAHLSQQGVPLQQEAQTQQSATPFDESAFLKNNRIHIEHGSYFNVADPLLVVHPREMAQSNLQNLVQKVVKAYTMDHPSFFADGNKAPVALALAGLMPMSLEAEHAALADNVKHVVTKQQTGQDPDIAKQVGKEQNPFAAVIEEYLKNPDYSVAESEQAQKAIGSYLVVEEALKQQGFKEPLYSFAQGVRDTEGLVSKLSQYLGVKASDFTAAARDGGVAGVANLLNVSPDYVQEVARLTDSLSEHKFSANAVQNWKIGREVLQQPLASTSEKMAAGIVPRVQMKIQSLQQHFAGQSDIPEQLKESELNVQAAIRMLPPVLSEALFRVGAEFAYTPERTVQPIAPDIPAYGFHRRVTQRPDDIEGIYQIFVSGKHDVEEFKRVMVHEANHFFAPTSFTAEDIEAVDQLAGRDMDRLQALKGKMDEWNRGDATTKARVRTELDAPEFAVQGMKLSDVVSENEMDNFHNQVSHAAERLQIDSEFYHRSGYNTPESKFQEINSRYSELRYVSMKNQPELLQFLVPGQTTIHDHIYLPHVERTLDMLRARDAGIVQVAAAEQPAANDEHHTPANVTPIHQPQPIAADALEVGGLLDPLDRAQSSQILGLPETSMKSSNMMLAGNSALTRDTSVIL